MSGNKKTSEDKTQEIANRNIKMKKTPEMECSRLMKELSIMLSRSPFVMESFLNENNVLNISVRYSPESSQQRGGKKAREKRRERREQERTSLENGEIKEERNEYGIQDNQSDDSDIHRIQDYCEQACLKLFPEKHHLDAGPVTSFKKPVTSRHRDQIRLVKVKPDRENTGHLIGLLEHKMEHKFKLLEQKIQLLESERQKDQEQMSSTRQTERLKSKHTDKQNRQTNRTWCFYCQSYVTQLHYCNIKNIYIHEDSWNLMNLEGNNETELSLVARYRNKFDMRDDQKSKADKWLKKKHDEEKVLAEERQHMLMKTKPRAIDEQPILTEEPNGELVLKWKLDPVLGPNLQNKYLVEYARITDGGRVVWDEHRGKNVVKYNEHNDWDVWNNLAVTEKGPLDKIKLSTFPWDQNVGYKFQVSVINRHGMSPASKCTLTTDMSEENRAIWEKIRQSPENMERRKQQREHEQRIQSNILKHKL